MAARLSEKSGRPVKIVMTRDEVFRATGPAPGSKARIRIGATSDGELTAIEGWIGYVVGCTNDMAGFIGAILAELKITPTGVGDIISYSRSVADYPSMYAAIFSIIALAVLFLNLLERLENVLFEGNNRGYASD